MRRNPFHHPTEGVGLQAKIVIHRALRERRTRFVSEKSREQLILPAKPGHRVHHLTVTAQFQIKRAAPIRPDADPAKLKRDIDRLLPQITDAARSIRALADLLSRHPEALIKGRTNTGKE